MMKLNRWMTTTEVALALATLTRAAVYVDQAATGANDGTSWADAYTNLTDALSAGGVDEIWVAQGHYVPGLDRSQAFALKADTVLYGGFTNGMASRAQRDWNHYPAILSGDIGAPGNPADNSYHVVIGAANATLDGFVITGGCNTNVTTVGWNQEGAGLYASNGSPAIANCVFSNNVARRGGGLFLATGQASLDNCRVTANTAIDAGGGLYAYQWGGKILNSVFNINGRPAKGGAIFAWYHRTAYPLLSNCLFQANQSVSYGGAFFAENMRLTIVDSQFLGNDSFSGGGLSTSFATCVVSNTLFVRNEGRNGGGGGGVQVIYGHSTTEPNRFTDCLFANNSASFGSGYYSLAHTLIENCTFVGHYHDIYGNDGGAIRLAAWSATPYGVVRNCLIAGNRNNTSAAPSYHGGGGIAVDLNGAVVENCTIAGNYTTRSGGGIRSSRGNQSDLTIRNTILFGNTAAVTGAQHYVANAVSTSTVSYALIEGGVAGTGMAAVAGAAIRGLDGNLADDPRFVGGPGGQWTAAYTYSSATCQSTLTDANASWTPNAWAGLTVNPDTSQWLQFPIVGNTATSLTVWGNANIAAKNDAYRITDYHVQSKNGHWTSAGWSRDRAHSPCIDAGDPLSAWTREPEPNGGRINIGAYGNTPQASLKYVPPGSILTLR